MPWRQTKPMDERVRFVTAYEGGVFGVSELCREYGVSRKTGYKWLARYKECGIDGLHDLSRAPHSCPHRMCEDVAEALLAARRTHPHWGTRKLIAHLARRNPHIAQRLPAASTAFDLLNRSGLVTPRKTRRRPHHPGSTPLVAEQPNDVWSIDFKGEFRTKDGSMCYPLTVKDAHSRYLLACEALPSVACRGVRPVLDRLFAEVGIPKAMRSDNGAPFCSPAIGGLSKLSVWWMKSGIAHQRTRPATPQDNPRHERMHRTLKEQTARPAADNLLLQQSRFDGFRQEYNHERPHEALEMRTPASAWRPSELTMPVCPQLPDYPGYMEVRTVHHKGEIKFLGHRYFVSEVLAREQVALEEVDDGIWSLFFLDRLLGRLDQAKRRLVPVVSSTNSGARP